MSHAQISIIDDLHYNYTWFISIYTYGTGAYAQVWALLNSLSLIPKLTLEWGYTPKGNYTGIYKIIQKGNISHITINRVVWTAPAILSWNNMWQVPRLHMCINLVDLDCLPVSSCDDTSISSCVSPSSTEFSGSSEFWVLFPLHDPVILFLIWSTWRHTTASLSTSFT